MMILEHVTNLQVFQGHEVGRQHSAPCRFYSKVSTLALNFQMRSTQTINRFAPILRTFGLFADSALRPFESPLRFPQMSWVFDCVAIRIGVEVVQSHIQPNRPFRRLSFFS
jgi:hypothetical protein